jgi:hypothetical protein
VSNYKYELDSLLNSIFTFVLENEPNIASNPIEHIYFPNVNGQNTRLLKIGTKNEYRHFIINHCSELILFPVI